MVNQEIAQAQSLINNMKLGEAKNLKELYGSLQIPSPATTFGKNFKRAVKDGILKHLEVLCKNSKNHYFYRRI